MKTNTLFASALAVLGLTACEKGLVDEAAVSTTGQVGNSVLQVRTCGASGDGATVAYPVAVYVFEGEHSFYASCEENGITDHSLCFLNRTISKRVFHTSSVKCEIIANASLVRISPRTACKSTKNILERKGWREQF